MNQNEKFIEGFQIIGIKTRTSNQDEMKGAGKIPALWNRFYSEDILGRISGKLTNEIVAVYHDYESDANAPYSLLIGAKVASGSKVPVDMELLSIPAQKYNLFTSNKGEMPGVIFDLWKNIWSLTERSQLKRKYSFDLEIYDERASNPKAAEVDLYIAHI